MEQMVATGFIKTYFVVWTSKVVPLINVISFDKLYCDKMLPNPIVFSKLLLHHVFWTLKESAFVLHVINHVLMQMNLT